MAYEVEFAGNKLHEYFKILKIQRTVLPPRNNFTKEIPSIHGSLYTGYKYQPKKITLECALTAEDNEDFMDKAQIIAYILDTKSPSKMILGDSKDIYYYAVVDGETNIERIYKHGKFNIDFICYDPIGYSVEDDKVDINTGRIAEVLNSGTTDAYPKVSVVFNNNTHFLKCKNSRTSETILIGTPPSKDKEKASFQPVVLDDSCEVLTDWTNVGNVLDVDREVTGNLTINQGGYGICLGTAGTGTSWHGGAMRRNLNTNVTDFQVKLRMEHNSWGDVKGTGAGSTPPATSGGATVKYKVTADPSLRVRSGRGTSYAKIGSYLKGAIVDVTNIDKNWGQVTYSGQTGYISMEYVVKYTAPTTTPSSTYMVNTSAGLNVRSGRGTKYSRLTAMPYKTQVTVSEISDGWGKVSYSGKTGYCAMQYMKKVTGGTSMYNTGATEEPSAESRVGVVEVYGFDAGGNKLFKAMLKDSEEFYESTKPYVEFGSKTTLEDSHKCPAPKTVAIKDDEGKYVLKNGAKQYEDIDSGKDGEWNEFYGIFTIQRVTKNGKQTWSASIEKIGKDNKVVKKLTTQNLVGSYPTGDLNNIIIFIGGHGDSPVVDAMNVTDIEVTNLANPPAPEVIKPIFKANDLLTIDMAKQKVYKNKQLFMTELDLGSQFFSVPVGETDIEFSTDDTGADIEVITKSRWI